MSPSARRRSPLLLALLVFASGGPAVAQDRAAIAAAARQLIDGTAMAGARVGIAVDDLATGERLFSADADKGFLTASTMKVLTAAAALQVLGPQFTFATGLEAGGAIADGVLSGDLVLVGDGDPSFGAVSGADPLASLQPFVDAVQQLGIQKVAGRIVGVDDVQDDQPLGEGWQWDYLHEDYAAPFSGLCFADNVTTLFVSGGGSEGAAPKVRLVPDVGQSRLVCELRCGAPGSPTALRVQRPAGSATVRLLGAVAADAKDQALPFTIENPTRFAAQALRAALVQRGIAVVGPAVDADDVGGLPVEARRRIHEQRSRPLAELLQRLLKQSQNLWAEQLWRTVARRSGQPSDQQGCETAVAQALAALAVPTAGMVLADGSGLSRRSLVQPGQLVAALTALVNGPHRDAFVAALPIAGVDGTLAKRCLTGPARGHVRAKTGFVSRVVCLAGYVERSDGRPPLVFAAMLNNFTCTTDDAKAALDAFVQELAAQAGWPRQ